MGWLSRTRERSTRASFRPSLASARPYHFHPRPPSAAGVTPTATRAELCYWCPRRSIASCGLFICPQWQSEQDRR